MTKRLRLLALLGLSSTLLFGCGRVADDDDTDDDDSAGDDDDSSPPPDFAFWATDFEDGGTLPDQYACCQPNPELRWEGVPEDAVTLALILDDPTAGNFAHWAIFNIPASEAGLDAGVSGVGFTGSVPTGARELQNGFQFPGYLGSCPGGTNTYRWRLWALDAELDTATSASYGALESDLGGHVIEEIEMSHSFGPAGSLQNTCM